MCPHSSISTNDINIVCMNSADLVGGIKYAQSLPAVLPMVLGDMTNVHARLHDKISAVKSLHALTTSFPKHMMHYLSDIIPALASCTMDSKDALREAAIDVVNALHPHVGNGDIAPVLPALLTCITSAPDNLHDCVTALAATTFVQSVEAPALALLLPLLLRALRHKATTVKRKALVILENMAKLVDAPHEAAAFLTQLKREVEYVHASVADPECRAVADKVLKTLIGVLAEASNNSGMVASAEDIAEAMQHIQYNNEREIQVYWTPVLRHLLRAHTSSTAADAAFLTSCGRCDEEAVDKILALKHQFMKKNVAKDDIVDPGSLLCDCEFSLAYGAKILMNNARMRLVKGRRYGLCGANGAGKSTLMRAITNGQVDGFPSADIVRTVYVEHDIDASDSDMTCLDYCTAEGIADIGVAEQKLKEYGFTDMIMRMPIAALSGGWKMKLALARAMLMGADILLLDEPTNHLDVKNVTWLVDYLQMLNDVTCMIVSHDSGFLDKVCTDILHLCSRKLKTYHGNLSAFVERVPEAKAYLDMANTTLSFKLPEPGFLEGVKTKDKAILKMDQVSFGYAMGDTVLNDVSLAVCLSSRVACLGANGAGKSTLIKLLTGELTPVKGTIWRHPNLRVAYVAQHAFHHIERHTDKTPVAYIQWRFAPGDDRESLERATRARTVEDIESMQANKILAPDGTKRAVSAVIGRRKLRKDYEYEVQWTGLPLDQTSWLTREVLEEMGHSKSVNEIDLKEAAAAGMQNRTLTTANVQAHLDALGLDTEVSTHSPIAGLSGGQKVKLVLGAATWPQPHVLVLDEPTNYLDRESLGALAEALREFGGGVVVISHHSQFIDAVCKERWQVGDGRVVVTGATGVIQKEKVTFQKVDTVTDAFGNTIKVKDAKPSEGLSNKEKKQRAKMKKARRDRGEVVSDDSQDES